MPTQETSSASPSWAVSGTLQTFLSSFTASAGWSFPPGRSVTGASPLFLEVYDAADGLATVHQLQGVLYLLQRHGVCDQGVYLYLAVRVPVHDPRHVRPAPRPAEGRPLPR